MKCAWLDHMYLVLDVVGMNGEMSYGMRRWDNMEGEMTQRYKYNTYAVG